MSERLASLAAIEALPEVAAAGPMRREYFGVVNAQVLALHWLELHPEGHRRAVFDGRGARWAPP